MTKSETAGITTFTLDDVEPGWVPLDVTDVLGVTPRFVSGDPHGRLQVRYHRREGDGRLVGRALFGPGAEGPPGHAHGGSMAALLDETMGIAAWIAGHPVLALEISARFKRMLPLGRVVAIETWVEGATGRRVRTRGHVVDERGDVFCEGTGTFVTPERALSFIELRKAGGTR